MCLVPYVNCMTVKPSEDHSSWTWVSALRVMLIAQILFSAVCFLAFRWIDGVMIIFSALFGILVFWYRVREDGFQLLMVMTFVITTIMMAVWSLVAILLFYTSSRTSVEKDYNALQSWQKDCYKASIIGICAIYTVLAIMSSFAYKALRDVFMQEAQYQQVPGEEAFESGRGNPAGYSFNNSRGHRLDE